MPEQNSISTPTQRNRALVEAFLASFWNGQDFGATDRLLSADYVDHAYQPPTVAGLHGILRELSAAFPDHLSTIEQITAEDDRVVVRLTVTGTHQGTFRGIAPTHQPITVTAYRTFRIADGQIAEHWALFDTTSLLRQIGTAPATA